MGWHFLAEMLYPTTEQARRAWRTAVAMVATCFVALYLHFDDPYWAVISAIMIMDRYVGTTLLRAVLRLLGTIAGAVIGYLLAGLVIHSLMLFTLVFFLVSALTCYKALTSQYPYAFIIGGITCLLVLGTVVMTPLNTYTTAVWRTIEVMTGCIIAMITLVLVFPNDSEKIIRGLFRQQAKALADLFDEVTQQYFLAEKSEKTFIAELGKIQQDVDASLEQSAAAIKELFHSPIALHRLQERLLWQSKFIKQLRYLILSIPPAKSYPIFTEIEAQFQPLSQSIMALFELMYTKGDFLVRYRERLQHTQDCLQALEQRVEEMRNDKSLFVYLPQETVFLHQLLQNSKHIIKLLDEYLFLSTSKQIKQEEKAVTESMFPFYQQEQKKLSIQQSIKTGLSAVVALVGWIYSDWPGGFQGFISSFVISLQKNTYDSQLFAELRLLGAMVGAGVGLTILYFFNVNITGLLLILFFFGWIFAYFSYSGTRYFYAGVQANFALAIIFVQNMQPESLDVMLQRVFGIVLGIFSIYLVAILLWPVHPKKLLTNGLARINDALANAFQKIFVDQSLNIADRIKLREYLGSYFQQNMTLINSLRTYAHEKDKRLPLAEEVLGAQKKMTTLIFSLADCCQIADAQIIAQDLQIKLVEHLQGVAALLNHHDSVDYHEAVELKQQLMKDLEYIRSLGLPLPCGRERATNLVTAYSGLINIVTTYIELQQLHKRWLILTKKVVIQTQMPYQQD